MDFSILIPTRNRPTLLADAIESIIQTTDNKQQTEIVITYDSDDNSSAGVRPNLVARFDKYMPIKFLVRERSFNTSEDYYNWMARQHSTGKYIIASNDDVKFLKQGWDTEAKKRLEEYLQPFPDGIVYGVTADMEKETKRNEHFWFSCFPLISRRAVEAVGFFFDPMIYRDGADWDVFGLYKEIERVLDLRNEIIIQHLSVRSGRRNADSVDSESPLIQQRVPKIPAGTNFFKHTHTLREYIALHRPQQPPSST